MINTIFEQWYAGLFGQSQSDVERLLGDKTAVQFLIAWSLFESRCFSGFVKLEKMQNFADRIAGEEKFDVSSISEHANYFHGRYQSDALYKNLYYNKSCRQIDNILKVPVDNLNKVDTIVFATYVVYRFRNNIFHGNKGVNSWLNFKEQIGHCTNIMQQLISHAENFQPQLKVV